MISLKSAILLGALLAIIVTIWEQWRGRRLYEKFKKTHTREQCKELMTLMDFWRMKYLEAYKEVVKANKGIRRLKNKLKKYNHTNSPEPPA